MTKLLSLVMEGGVFQLTLLLHIWRNPMWWRGVRTMPQKVRLVVLVAV